MHCNTRVWKAGAMGAAAAILAILFVQNLGNWVKGLNGDFIVYGQTGSAGGPEGPGSGTGLFTGGAGSAPTMTKIIPQIAVGSFDGVTKYSTIIQVFNTGTDPVTLSGEFYKEEPGGAAGTSFPVNFTSNVSSLPTFTSAFSGVTIQPNASLILTSRSGAAGSVGWGKITGNGNISVSTVFEFRDGASDLLYSRVGVSGVTANMSKFAMARVRNVDSVLDVGFALVNTGSTAATITATLYDSSGVAVGAPQNIAVAPNGHIAKFVQQLFSLTNEPSGTNYSYVLLSSNSSQWASVALAYEGGNLTSFAIERLQ
jgi:hypothetical protein